MMYASFRNSLKLGVFLVCVLAQFMCAVSAKAEQPYAAPDGSQRYSYGPDHQGSESKKPMTGNSGRIDAYGNPVVPYEEEKAPSKRMQLPEKKPTRPLPDTKTDAGWKF